MTKLALSLLVVFSCTQSFAAGVLSCSADGIGLGITANISDEGVLSQIKLQEGNSFPVTEIASAQLSNLSTSQANGYQLIHTMTITGSNGNTLVSVENEQYTDVRGEPMRIDDCRIQAK